MAGTQNSSTREEARQLESPARRLRRGQNSPFCGRQSSASALEGKKKRSNQPWQHSTQKGTRRVEGWLWRCLPVALLQQAGAAGQRISCPLPTPSASIPSWILSHPHSHLHPQLQTHAHGQGGCWSSAPWLSCLVVLHCPQPSQQGAGMAGQHPSPGSN